MVPCVYRNRQSGSGAKGHWFESSIARNINRLSPYEPVVSPTN